MWAIQPSMLNDFERYRQWYPLLQEELEICGPDAKIVAVGKVVDEFLTQQGFPETFTRVISLFRQAVSARQKSDRRSRR